MKMNKKHTFIFIKYGGDGCNIFQCLNCRKQFEIRDYNFQYCLHCGTNLSAEIVRPTYLIFERDKKIKDKKWIVLEAMQWIGKEEWTGKFEGDYPNQITKWKECYGSYKSPLEALIAKKKIEEENNETINDIKFNCKYIYKVTFKEEKNSHVSTTYEISDIAFYKKTGKNIYSCYPNNRIWRKS